MLLRHSYQTAGANPRMGKVAYFKIYIYMCVQTRNSMQVVCRITTFRFSVRYDDIWTCNVQRCEIPLKCVGVIIFCEISCRYNL